MLSATILIAVVVGLVVGDATLPVRGVGGVWLLPLVLVFAAGTAWEFATMLRGSGRSISRLVAVPWATAVALSAAIPMVWPLLSREYPTTCPVGRLGWIGVATAAAVFGTFGHEVVRFGRGPAGATERSAMGLMVVVYVGVNLALLVALRQMGGPAWGLAAVLTVIAVTKSGDIGAYTTGKLLGGKLLGEKKLIPRLSPGKTREGAVGAVVFGVVVAYLMLTLVFGRLEGTAPVGSASVGMLRTPWVGALTLGGTLTVVGIFGDLVQSMIKRDSGAKDSGAVLPGMGGVWDVSDSLLATAAPGYLLFAAGVGW